MAGKNQQEGVPTMEHHEDRAILRDELFEQLAQCRMDLDDEHDRWLAFKEDLADAARHGQWDRYHRVEAQQTAFFNSTDPRSILHHEASLKLALRTLEEEPEVPPRRIRAVLAERLAYRD